MADNIARLYPARVQPDGRVFYRGVDQAGKLTEGWTDQLSMAHPHYRRKDAPAPLSAPLTNEQSTTDQSPTPEPEEATMAAKLPTALDDDFNPVVEQRVTEYMHYPLPPHDPARAATTYGQWGWYKLPHPETGRPTGYPRATTIAKTLEDRSGLEKWNVRERVQQVLALTRMDPKQVIYTDPTGETTAADALGALDDAIKSGKVYNIDNTLTMIDNVMGGADARELGECAHDWLGALAAGRCLMKDVPDVVKPHVKHGLRVIAHRGLVMLPEYTERTVLNTAGDENVAGKIDCIFRIVTTGELVLGDVKTSKSLEYSWLAFAVQIGGVYGWASQMLTMDGKGWEPMPDIREDFAILLHIPSNQPDLAAAITIDKWFGGESLVASIETRQRRKNAEKLVPQHAVPVPSKAAIRYAEARTALSQIETQADGQKVYETYSDVWDDELNEFGGTVAELV
jgi:hypothetical protein